MTTGERTTGGRRHAAVTAAGVALLLGLTLPSDAVSPASRPSDGPPAAALTAASPPAPSPSAADPAAPAARPPVRKARRQTARAAYSCMGRHSRLTLRAARAGGGGRVEITLTARGLRSPVALSAGDVDVTLRLTGHRRGRRDTVAFTGTNPRIRDGGPLRAGPLRAKVAEGTRLDSHLRGDAALELHRGLLGVRCTALSAQRPGPFRF